MVNAYIWTNVFGHDVVAIESAFTLSLLLFSIRPPHCNQLLDSSFAHAFWLKSVHQRNYSITQLQIEDFDQFMSTCSKAYTAVVMCRTLFLRCLSPSLIWSHELQRWAIVVGSALLHNMYQHGMFVYPTHSLSLSHKLTTIAESLFSNLTIAVDIRSP